MFLKDYEQWLDNLKEYYRINDYTIYNDSLFNIYVNDLKNIIENYKSKTIIKEKFKDTILYIYSYVNLKYCLSYDKQPEIMELINEDKVINLFGLFCYELTENYDNFFEIIFSPDTGLNTIVQTEKYLQLKEDLEKMHEYDIERCDDFIDRFSNDKNIKNKILYMTLNNSIKIHSYSIQPKNYILYSMDGEILLNEYNWKIFGLNSEDNND